MNETNNEEAWPQRLHRFLCNPKTWLYAAYFFYTEFLFFSFHLLKTFIAYWHYGSTNVVTDWTLSNPVYYIKQNGLGITHWKLELALGMYFIVGPLAVGLWLHSLARRKLNTETADELQHEAKTASEE